MKNFVRIWSLVGNKFIYTWQLKMDQFFGILNCHWMLIIFPWLNCCFVQIIWMVSEKTIYGINPKEDFSAMVLLLNKVPPRYDFKCTVYSLHVKLNMFLILLEGSMKLVKFVIYICWKTENLVALFQ